MKLETHVHTRFSPDSIQSLWGIYIKCKIRGIDTIAITDHNTVRGGKKFYDRFCKCSKHKYWFVKGINVIVGSEIMTTHGEVIGLFLKDEIPKGFSVEETVNLIKEQNGIVYIPHPYDEKRKKTVIDSLELKKVLKDVDCAEVYNGRNVEDYYAEKQREIVESNELTKVVGSDAHTLMEIGRNYMIYNNDYKFDKKEDFILCIKEANFETKKCILFAHKLTKFAKIMNMITRGDINEMFRIINKRIARAK